MSPAIAFRVSARPWSSSPRIVPVSRAVADSNPLHEVCSALRFDVEDPEHHFISCVSNHPTGLRIYFTGNMTAQFEKFNADAVEPSCFASREVQFSDMPFGIFYLKGSFF